VQKSTGPKTTEGKERSRANAVKHGLTGSGVALPAEDAAEVERRERSFGAELRPSGSVGRTLVRRMAVMAVRMDRCVDQERAHLTDHVRQALEEFDADWPAEEGVDDPFREQLRDETAHRAMFDPSKPACLARKHEAAAERCFFRSLKEFRQVERAAQAGEPVPAISPEPPALGSFLHAEPVAQAVEPPAPMVEISAPEEPTPAPQRESKVRPIFDHMLYSPARESFEELPFPIARAG
jgi:hypothetical protein